MANTNVNNATLKIVVRLAENAQLNQNEIYAVGNIAKLGNWDVENAVTLKYVKSLNGQIIDVYGYATGVSGSNKYLNICMTEIIPYIIDEPTYPGVDTIKSVNDGDLGSYEVCGVVTAVNKYSFLLSDHTGSILVYMGSSWNQDVYEGQKIKLQGTTTVYAKATQFSKDVTYEVVGEEEINYPAYKSIGGMEADLFASASSITPTFVKVYGVLSISGNYYNLAINNANVAIGSISYPINGDELAGLNGKFIQVYGYLTGVSGSNTYLNIIATSVTEVLDISISQANDIASTKLHNEYTEEAYKITATITDISNTTYGNMTITDGTSSIYVYGLYNDDGYKYGDLSSKPDVGDVITLVGSLGKYNTTNQMKNAVLYGFESNSSTVTNSVNFFMINDTHGAFLDSCDSVSIGRVDTLIDKLTEQNGEYIKIHNGDALQGTYISGQMYGLPIIESLNIMDFDCFVIGNHEFDWGLDKIAVYADGDLSNGEASFPFLGANIYLKGTSTRPDWIEAYTVVEYGDVKVGIIGVMGPDQESSILTSNVKDYNFVDPYNIVKTTAQELRTVVGCDVVVVATHDHDDTFNSKVAALTGNSRIDAIFTAHTHQLINETLVRSDGVNIPVVQNYHKNNRGTGVTINLDEENNMISAKVIQYNPENYAISNDILALIDKYQALITEANESLGYTSSSISKSKLGGYAVAAMLDYDYDASKFAGIDVTIINTGGVRSTITSGDITRASVFEVFPFNNKIVLVNMKGSVLKSLCSKNESYFYIGVSSQIGSYTKLKDNEVYQLAVIDYVFEGTYYKEFSSLSSSDYLQTEIIMRDLLIDYIDELY